MPKSYDNLRIMKETKKEKEKSQIQSKLES
jgi:hypothetical protein